MRLRVLFEEHEGMNFGTQEDNQDNNGKTQITWSNFANK